ncbi:hypothetical protein ABW16_01775 [Mycolicibacter heraklionensis]|uniref:Uncharacterized protein n=1 Tax=Mycolicibacter heraklionensis TaxID=512402 RepID=A0ABR5FKQ5_9MYCO|nr:hypothetical protein [Mycolicibacter heraklionensis]KLO31587.1 hypothetical protein ABW16_01775 [Mycolicibacter heraklionensis]
MSGYEVVAPMVNAADPDGRLQPYYAGSVIRWLNDVQRAHFVRLGLVVPLGDHDADGLRDDVPQPTVPPGAFAQEPTTEAAIEPVDRPAQVASKEQWVAYAVSQGMEFAEADAMSKVDLIAKYRD